MEGYCTHLIRRLLGRPETRTAIPFVLICLTNTADAHAWSAPYYLPVPLWLYAYGSASALILSFALLLFAPGAGPAGGEPTARRLFRPLYVPSPVIKIASLATSTFIALLIFSSLAGAANPFQNIGMTGFWVWYYLGFLYLSAIVGDCYRALNPFSAMLHILARHLKVFEYGCVRYMTRLGYYPSLVGYNSLICVELFGSGAPKDVGIFLLGYLAYALVGAFLFGRAVWLEYFDAFGVLFRLCSMLSPFSWDRRSDGRVAIRVRNPLRAISSSGPQHPSIVAFLCFMLSSTAYDGLHDAVPWTGLFWGIVYPVLADTFPGMRGDYALASRIFLGWQWIMLFVVSIGYYLVFRGTCFLSAPRRRNSPGSSMFYANICLTLLPIALFYNVCHYFVLFLNQGRQTLALLSDPLGRGWNLLQLAPSPDLAMRPLINMSHVWHVQVFLILLGHVLGVYVAHQITQCKVIKNNIRISEVPLLALTIALTVSGLWILSLPLA